MKKFIFLLVTMMMPIELQAAHPETKFWGFQLENDSFTSGNDSFYTHGTQISFSSTGDAPFFVKKIIDTLPFYRSSEVSIYSFSLGQKIFTPEDTEARNPMTNDRPYAGWAYLQTGTAHLFKGKGNSDWFNGFGLAFGMIGPSSLAKETQRDFHKLIGVDVPQGWDSQLHDEPGVIFTYIRKYRQIFNLQKTLQTELSYHGGGTLGNIYVYASNGFMVRCGTHLGNDIGPPTISPGLPGLPAFKPFSNFSWYAFAGAEGRAIVRNIFLDGNTFRNSHSVNKKTFVADLQIGIAFHYKNFRISICDMFRSKEFEGQPKQTHYGAINLTYYFAQ
ncbi:MAG: lipid A deacylase LpxR family protein [Desulfuromusa sp.]|jgi:hypothetical protein|nr:lipid A deacylase LpxR family protein [Desulfuromusa sp.]